MKQFAFNDFCIPISTQFLRPKILECIKMGPEPINDPLRMRSEEDAHNHDYVKCLIKDAQSWTLKQSFLNLKFNQSR
jgi:hypothetical protein